MININDVTVADAFCSLNNAFVPQITLLCVDSGDHMILYGSTNVSIVDKQVLAVKFV